MYNHLLYFSYWIINSLVLYVFSSIGSPNVVLGNWRFGPIEACIYAGFWITFIVWSLWDFAMARGVKFDVGIVTFGYFWTANIFSFWLVSRFSQYAGFGVANYLWILLMALAAFFIQRLAWKVIVRKSSK